MRSHITPPKIKYILQYTDSNSVLQTVDVTADFSNWKSFSTDIVRDDITGAFIQIQDGGISFTGDSYEIVQEIYETQGFGAHAKLIVSVRKDTFPDLWSYEQKVSLDLNFSSYVRTLTTIELNANENGLKSMIKSNASQKYDIPVETLTPDTLDYDGLAIKESLSWTNGVILPEITYKPILKQFKSTGNQEIFNFCPPIQAKSQDINSNYNNKLIQGSQPTSIYEGGVWKKWALSSWVDSESPNLIEVTDTQSFNLSIKCNLKAAFTSYIDVVVNSASFYLVKDGSDFTNISSQIKLYDVLNITHKYVYGYISTIAENVDVTIQIDNLLKGKYFIAMSLNAINTAPFIGSYDNLSLSQFEFESGGSIQIEWIETPKENISIPVVSEKKLVQALVDELTETTGVYTALVDEHDENIRIAAGESIRNFEKQYLHTSFNDFTAYMKSCWGYEYDIDGDTIRFSLRDKFFDSESALEISEINNFKLSVNTDYVYTGVKIGIALIQYQSINGVDEFRFLEEWSTGVKNVVNVLDLTCPYRTDAYGFQLLSEKQYKKNSTDDQSDNGIFVVHVIPSNGKFILDRSATITGVASPSTMFNAIFSPRKCLERNASLLGVSTSVLKFTSGLGNADISINGVSEKANIDITSALFTPDILECDIGEIVDLPINKNSLVSCTLNGKMYNGFIKKLSHYWGADQKTSATFFIKSITRDTSRDIDYDSRDYSPLDYKTK